MEIDPTFQPDLELWNSFEGLYKDPTNENPDEIMTVRFRDGQLFVAEGEHEAEAKAIGERSFLSELGLIEFEDTGRDGVKILVWGKATRYYPVDPDEYQTRGVIRYLIPFVDVNMGVFVRARPAQTHPSYP